VEAANTPTAEGEELLLANRHIQRATYLLLSVAVLLAAGCSGNATGASDITPLTAQLNGRGTCDRGQTCIYWYRYRKHGDRNWANTPQQGSVIGPQSGATEPATVSGLAPSTPYEYQLCATVNRVQACAGPDGTAGSTESFTTGRRDPSGQALPRSDPPGWRLAFADDFSNDDVPIGTFSGCRQGVTLLSSHCSGLPASVDAKWWAYPDGWSGTPATGTYYPSKSLSIANGIMDYYIHSQSINGTERHIIDAPVPKVPGASGAWGGQTYGRYIVRMKVDSMSGYHVSFLLWPDDNAWPRDGEIDWPEADFDQNITGAFMHWQGATSGSEQDAYQSNTAMSSGWHTYEIDWTKNAVSFFIDRHLVGRSTDPAKIPDTAMHFVLQVGTSFYEGTPNDAEAGHLQLDWVTVYREAN
jgi:glycosyl hydrolase family 16